MKRAIGIVALIMVCGARAVSSYAVTETVELKSVGTVTLHCAQPGNWQFRLAGKESVDSGIITVDIVSPEAAVPPMFEIGFSVPLGEIGYLWTSCDDGRCALLPNWLKKYHSDIACSMPVYTFLDNTNTNCLTFAVSEPFRNLETIAGIDEYGASVEGKVQFFTTPEAPMTHYTAQIRIDSGNRFYGDAVREAVQWIADSRGITPASVPATAFDPLYSTWYQFHQRVTADEIEAECDLASRMGMRTIILDDGWQTGDNNGGYAYSGDWEICKDKFPDMARHVRNVQDKGMRYMMWYSVPFVGVHSKNHERFKGKYLTGNHDRQVLDPRFPEVREFLCNTYEQALREWNIDGFKLDFIDDFKFIGEDPAVTQNYAGRDIKSLPESVDTLMTQIRRRLAGIRPDVLIEFRQKYTGPAIRQYGNMLRATDCPADPRGNRARIASLRLTSGNTAVHSDMLEWNLSDSPEVASRHILSAIFGVIQYSMNLRKVPESHIKMMKHWIDFSQKHRETLLHSEFRPYYPQSGYPVIETESESEMIIATYESDRIVSVKPTDKTIYILNVTEGENVPVELQAGPRHAKIFDTFGNSVRISDIQSGISRISVPIGGYVIIS